MKGFMSERRGKSQTRPPTGPSSRGKRGLSSWALGRGPQAGVASGLTHLNLTLAAMALCLALACVVAIWTVIAMSAVPAKADRLKWQPWSSEGRTQHV
jgi:hypothetical protein